MHPSWPGGVLTTASGLTITSDGSGHVLGLDTATGKILWHSNTGGRVLGCHFLRVGWSSVCYYRRRTCGVCLDLAHGGEEQIQY